MPSRKRSANKTRKMILTAVIGSLAALGIGGAGYVTWSALSATSAAETVAAQQSSSHRGFHSAEHAEKTSTVAHRKTSSHHKTRASKLKTGASCKISKSKKHKVAKHKASKHKRKKLRHAH